MTEFICQGPYYVIVFGCHFIPVSINKEHQNNTSYHKMNFISHDSTSMSDLTGIIMYGVQDRHIV